MENLKWYIERTPKNYKEINRYLNRVSESDYEANNAFLHVIGGEREIIPNNCWVAGNPAEGHIEVNLDEFRALTMPKTYSCFSVKHDTGFRLLTGSTFMNFNGKYAEFAEEALYPLISIPVYREVQRLRKIDYPTYVDTTDWKSMQDAPKDGTIFVPETFHEEPKPLQQAPDVLGDMMFKHIEYHKESLQAFISFSHSLGYKLTFESKFDKKTNTLTTTQLFEPEQQITLKHWRSSRI